MQLHLQEVGHGQQEDVVPVDLQHHHLLQAEELPLLPGQVLEVLININRTIVNFSMAAMVDKFMRVSYNTILLLTSNVEKVNRNFQIQVVNGLQISQCFIFKIFKLFLTNLVAVLNCDQSCSNPTEDWKQFHETLCIG